MKNICNQVQLIGRLGAKPEMIKLENGNSLAKMTLATNEYYKNKNGEKVEDTQWHRLIAWGKLADNMAALLDKGREVAISGKITYNTYTNKEGQTVYTTEIVVQEFMLIGARKSSVAA